MDLATNALAAVPPRTGVSDVLPWAIFALLAIGTIGMARLGNSVFLGPRVPSEARLPRQIALVVAVFIGLIACIVAIPDSVITDALRGDLLSLIGLGVTATITLSSTTLAANGMSGLMLRGTARFRGGDWIRVGEHIGRVTERGLFHTEIQTEDRDLLSLPNLYLATNPVRIVQAKGTVVSAEVGLGYDVPNARVRELLVKAATDAGLVEPFVWVTDLLDHAVVYRIAGTLTEVSGLISARSKLRVAVLDTLHGAGIEIASPGLVYQRRVEPDHSTIPKRVRTSRAPAASETEASVFDKADEAAQLETLEREQERLTARLDELKAERKSAEDKAAIDAEVDSVERELAALIKDIGGQREKLA